MAEPKYIRLKRIEDLVNIVITAQMPLIHHLEYDGHHVYFIPFLPFADTGVIYYVLYDRPLPGRFVVYNKFDGSVFFSNFLRGDTRLTFVPIVEVADQNVFSLKDLVPKAVRKKKKGATIVTIRDGERMIEEVSFTLSQ